MEVTKKYGGQLILLNEKRYFLNKSRSKYVFIALSYDYGFQPCIALGGNKSNPVVFTEFDWKEFTKYSGILTNYFYSTGHFDPISTTAFTITFESYNDIKYIRVEDRQSNFICFGNESLCQLWQLLPLVDYRTEMLKRQDFQKYFNSQLNGATKKDGDICQQILNTISPSTNPGSENVSTMMELLYQHSYLPDFQHKYNLTYYTTY